MPVKAREEQSFQEVPPEMENRLKRLYRRLALKYHPDKNPDDPEASERFQALTRAYRALVGDTAGPEEGDEDAKDPFQVAHETSYRVRAKEFWRHEGHVHQGNPNKRLRRKDEEEDDTEAKVAEAFGRSDDEDEAAQVGKSKAMLGGFIPRSHIFTELGTVMKNLNVSER